MNSRGAEIVLLHYAAHPIVGGVESVLRQHSRLMAQAGHQVRIVAGRGAQVDPEVQFVQCDLVDSQSPRILAMKRDLDDGRVPPDFESLSSEIEIRLRDIVGTADWLFAHNVCSLNKNLPLTNALYRMASAADLPRLVLWHHDLAWANPLYAQELHEGHPWNLLRSDWPGAVQVAVSGYRRNELAALWGTSVDRIRVIPNGIEPGDFLGLRPPTLGLVQKYALWDAEPLLLLPARITRRKNIEQALRICAALRETMPMASLIVTGPLGPHNESNTRYAKTLTSLRADLGLQQGAVFASLDSGEVLADAVVHDLFRLADAVLLPSQQEGFGIPILEAGLAGIPIFCSQIEPLQELGMEQAHYFLPDGDPRAIARQIQSVLAESREYGLRRRVLRDFAWDRIFERHMAPLLEKG